MPTPEELRGALQSSGHWEDYQLQASKGGSGRMNFEDPAQADPRRWVPIMMSPALGNPNGNTLQELAYHKAHNGSSPMLCHATLCCATLCYATLRYAMLCYATLCYAMLRYAMLCYATLRYAMLCYAAGAALPVALHQHGQRARSRGASARIDCARCF
jgi:hypothetical protein